MSQSMRWMERMISTSLKCGPATRGMPSRAVGIQGDGLGDRLGGGVVDGLGERDGGVTDGDGERLGGLGDGLCEGGVDDGLIDGISSPRQRLLTMRPVSAVPLPVPLFSGKMYWYVRPGATWILMLSTSAVRAAFV